MQVGIWPLSGEWDGLCPLHIGHLYSLDTHRTGEWHNEGLADQTTGILCQQGHTVESWNLRFFQDLKILEPWNPMESIGSIESIKSQTDARLANEGFLQPIDNVCHHGFGTYTPLVLWSCI